MSFGSSPTPGSRPMRRSPSSSSNNRSAYSSRPMFRSASSSSDSSYPNNVGSPKTQELGVERRRKIEENLKAAGPYPLTHRWTFYIDRHIPNATPEQYEEGIQHLHTVSTVQEFWSVYNNIMTPDQLNIRNGLHFMKNGIRPVWEDPHNENGGAWHFRVNKKDTTLVWRELLMMLIGEQFDDFLSKEDDVFGLSVGSRYSSDIFTIWNKNAKVHEQSRVLDRLMEILKKVELQSPYYKAHKDHAAFKKPSGTQANGTS